MDIALEAEMKQWLVEGIEVLWEDTHRFPDGFLQRNLLAVDRDEGSVIILRGWVSSDGRPAVSVDLSVPYEVFAGEIEPKRFPHAANHGDDRMETHFRAALLGEHVEILWQSSGPGHAAFVARSAKVGRDEHVVAGTVEMTDGSARTNIGLRQKLATLKPFDRRTIAP